MAMARVSSPDFWQELYERGGDGWELGTPAPPLVNFIETTPPPRGRVAVRGCGRGHDTRYLACHWEYTCFCAIDPRRRADYVATLNGILKPGGWLLACFYPMRRGGAGPPFAVARSEVRRLLAPSFRIERAFAPPRSVARRQGQEWMVLARRIGGP